MNVKQYVQVEATTIGSRLGMNYVFTYVREWEKNNASLAYLCERYLRALDRRYL